MDKAVLDFISAKEGLHRHFNCPDNYFVNYVAGSPWKISEDEGIYFLSYWKDDSRQDAVIVKRCDKPLIYKTQEATMVIAIDCVKIAFILENSLEKD